MEMYAAHKQTGARLIRAAPLIHRQPPACTSPGLFLGSFTKQMYLIKKETPEQPESVESCTAVSKGAALSPGDMGTGLAGPGVTLGSPLDSQKPPVRPATGLRSLRHNTNWFWYPPSQHPLPDPYTNSAPHHPHPGYHCAPGNPDMPKASACPFGGGSFCPEPHLLLLQPSEMMVKPQTPAVQGHRAPLVPCYPLPHRTQRHPQDPTIPPHIPSHIAPLLVLSFSPTKSCPSQLCGGG